MEFCPKAYSEIVLNQAFDECMTEFESKSGAKEKQLVSKIKDHLKKLERRAPFTSTDAFNHATIHFFEQIADCNL